MTDINMAAYQVLVADDDELILMLIKNTLTKHNCEVTTAKDGDEALRMSMNKEFDLVITDILMPGVEGFEFIPEILDKYPNTKIVAISGEGRIGHTSYLELAQTVGAGAGLQKPFLPSQLISIIQDVGISLP